MEYMVGRRGIPMDVLTRMKICLLYTSAIERLCMETASMAVFAPGIAVLLSLQQLDIRKVNPQKMCIRDRVNGQ